MDDPTAANGPAAGGEDRLPDAPLTAPLGTPPPEIERQDWHILHLWQVQMVRDVLIIGGIVGLLYLGYRLSIVTVPLLLALTLAYLFEPLVRWLTGRFTFFSRSGVAVLILLVGGSLVILPATLGAGVAVAQGASFARELSTNITQLNAYVASGGTDPGRLRPDSAWLKIGDELLRLRRQHAAEGAPPPRPETPPPADEPGGAADGEGAGGEGGAPAAEPTAGELVEDFGALAELDTGPGFAAWVFSFVQRNAEAISRRVLGTGAGAFEAAVNTFTAIGMFLFTLFLTGFFFYFFCTGYGTVLKFWDELIPERKRGRVFYLLGKMDRVISGFIRGRLVVCACLVVYFIAGYWIVGVPAPLIVGAVVGVLAVIPYVAMIGLPLSIAIMWLDPPGGWRAEVWWIFVGPIAVYLIGQALDDYVLTPVIQGKSTGMDTPTILFASLAGGALAGFYGLLLAVPVAACLKILLQEIFLPRLRAWVAGRAEDVLPIAKD